MLLFRAPGVYRPQEDTWLLARAMAEVAVPADARVLDICTGTGALAIQAARLGTATVTAVDISRAALASAWLNSRWHRVNVELLHGDFARTVAGRQFDLVLANPPYVPCADARPPHGRARSWDAGRDGRAVLDSLCRLAPEMLSARGTLLIVHSALCGPDSTLNQLRDNGLKAAVVARETIPFGEVLRARRQWLATVGLIEPDQSGEELVVIRADQPRR
ncbi:HemK2/MTQ2 family protein methyltransferase [Nocardia sp. NPDC050406]|uniref:HemK2/MTQ2 family protein methyltransferase n=1 Tax=Nocardia sp. NPDC050406 TaxID=3364318 RepID=UPI00378F8EAF